MSVVSEIADLRKAFVDLYIERRIDHRNGDFTSEQYDGWERDAREKWREMYPALTAMLPSHVSSEVSAQ